MSRERESRETARQNSPTQKGTESNLTDVERVEDAARAIARAIEDASDDFWNAQVEATKPKNRLVSSMLFVASTWVIFFAIFSGLTLLVGVALYNVGPFHALERIGREQQQVEAKKDLSELRIDSGNSLLNVGEAKAAKEEFEAALELDPFSQEAQEGRMKSELFEAIEAEEYDLAVIRPKLDTLAEERKKDSHVYAFRGTVLFYAQPDKALEQYKKAVSLDPKNAYAYDGQALIYYAKHEYDRALEMSKEARDLAPWNPTYKHNYAADLTMNKRYEEATKEYTDVTQLDPEFIYPYNDLAYVYRLRGNVSPERYWDNLSWSRWYYEQYIAMLNDEKITSLERNSDPVDIPTGKSDGSVATLVELSDKRYHAYYSLALTLYLMGYTDEAKKYVNKANELQLDPDLETQVKGALQYDIGLLPEEQEYFLDNLPSSSENSWLSRPN